MRKKVFCTGLNLELVRVKQVGRIPNHCAVQWLHVSVPFFHFVHKTALFSLVLDSFYEEFPAIYARLFVRRYSEILEGCN
jgi:hypothetical protein